MSIKIQAIEEALSISYVSAVVSQAGETFELIQRDYGVDLTIRKIDSFNGQLIDMGAILDFQLKSTINWESDDTTIIYDMEVGAYNKLVHRGKFGSYPCLLVILCLPRNRDNWISLNEECLELRKCCYWFELSGEPTKNSQSIRIRIPRANTFTPDSLLHILDLIGRNEL